MKILQEQDLSGLDLSGALSYMKYSIPLFGVIALAVDTAKLGTAYNLSSSQGFYDNTKAWLLKNSLTPEKNISIGTAIANYYTDIQRHRELLWWENLQMVELSELVETRTTLTAGTSVPRAPSGLPDYGQNIPNVKLPPDLNPFLKISETMKKFKWVFITAGGILTLYTGSMIYKNFRR